MPKKAFMSIPESKREKILACALDEFSSHVFHEASINRIIQCANIPRGSFYQYFDDKEDLYFYLFALILDSEQEAFFSQRGIQVPHDPVLFHQMMFTFNLKTLSNETYKEFFKRFYLSLDYRLMVRYRQLIDSLRSQVLARTGIADTQAAQKIRGTLDVLGLITMDLLAQKAMENLPDTVIWQRYHSKLEILGLDSHL